MIATEPAPTSTLRCIAAANCRNAKTVDGKRLGAYTTTANALCDSCTTHIAAAVKQLPNDWAQLRAALGERTSNTGTKIRSTPTPAIPISTRKDALAAAIVDMLDRAAAAVSNALHTGQPVTYHGRGYPTHAQHIIRASAAIVAPNITILAATPTEPALVWKKPARCHTHTHLISTAEDLLENATKPKDTHTAQDIIRRAYTAAGACDDCNGWGSWGQERELTELSGIQIAQQLVELHYEARDELGLTKLRIAYRLPCPDCGSRVYRNDGESIVTCEGDSKHTRTEREYKVLAGLKIEGKLDMALREFLLAEGYWRLDRVQGLINKMGDDPAIDLPGAGAIILDQLKTILAEGATVDDKPIGHQPPHKRATGTDRRAALNRQVDEDNWTWKQERPYQQPARRRRRKAMKPAGPPIHPSSLTTLVDAEESASSGRLPAVCGQCHEAHAGECA